MNEPELQREMSIRLRERGCECEVSYKLATGSTNADAKAYVRQSAHPRSKLFAAATQTHGRGRKGNEWQSADGGVYASLVLPCDERMLRSITLAAAATGVCVNRVLRTYSPSCCIKWPNDILCGGKKLCGIMCEVASSAAGRYCLIIGFGVNANNSAFSGELSSTAVSLGMLTGCSIDTLQLTADIACELLNTMTLEQLTSGELMDEYARASCLPGARVCISCIDSSAEGEVLGFDELGRIILDTANGVRCFDYGELSLRTCEHGAPSKAD
ncbi:MAG: biotin--[acetyl-CoA-carboxylase] ligase [Clostridia bacterium]|nr:biotin--[acetyl-CoA-carboxylase] ligase [Clostridia bacterium]